MLYFSNMIWWFFIPEIYPVSGFFPEFFRIFIKSSNFFIYAIIILFGNLSGFWILPGFFPDFFCFFPDFLNFSGFSSNLQISSQNGCFTYHIWYDDFLFKKFIRFPDFKELMVFFSNMIYLISGNLSGFRNFPDFSVLPTNLQILLECIVISLFIKYDMMTFKDTYIFHLFKFTQLTK